MGTLRSQLKELLASSSRVSIILVLSCNFAQATREPKSKPPLSDKEKWQPHVNVNIRAGTKRQIGQIGFIAPLYQKENKLLYADLRFMGDNKKVREGNFGIGHRWLINKNQQIVGIYGFFDHSQTAMENKINQLTVGAELLSNTWDYRANIYLPQKKTKKVILEQNDIHKGPHFQGGNSYRVYDVVNKVKKEVPQAGFDLEVGRSMPGYNPLKIYGAFYHFQGRDGAKSINGGRLRGRLAFNEHISLELEGSKDNVRKSIGFIGLTFKIPLGGPENKSKLTPLEKRMTETPQRDIDIVTSAVVHHEYSHTYKCLVGPAAAPVFAVALPFVPTHVAAAAPALAAPTPAVQLAPAGESRPTSLHPSTIRLGRIEEYKEEVESVGSSAPSSARQPNGEFKEREEKKQLVAPKSSAPSLSQASSPSPSAPTTVTHRSSSYLEALKKGVSCPSHPGTTSLRTGSNYLHSNKISEEKKENAPESVENSFIVPKKMTKNTMKKHDPSPLSAFRDSNPFGSFGESDSEHEEGFTHPKKTARSGTEPKYALTTTNPYASIYRTDKPTARKSKRTPQKQNTIRSISHPATSLTISHTPRNSSVSPQEKK